MAQFFSYAPDFKVKINDTPLPAAMRGSVVSLRYQDGLEGADRVEITLANGGLPWLDHPLLKVDNHFSLAIGYAPGPLEEVFVGEITGLNASFPNSSGATLTVVAQDFLQRLTTGAKDRAFKLSLPCIGQFPLPDPAVVSLVTLNNLLLPYPDPVGSALSFLTLMITYAVNPLEAKKGIRLQEGESDFDFLSRIAKENGWEMYIDHTMEPKGYVLRFRFLVQDYFPSVSLKWGASLQEFHPRITKVGQVLGVSTRIWVPSLKMEFVVVLSWDYDRASFSLMVYPGLGSLDDLLGPTMSGGVQKIQAIGPLAAPRQILGELLPRLNNRLTGSGATVGNPKIKAGEVINLEGLGEQFGGLYRVVSADHTIDSSGYRTAFEVRKEVWFGSVPTPKSAKDSIGFRN